MNKLKTLKDLKGFAFELEMKMYKGEKIRLPDAVMEEDLREEAIKWWNKLEEYRRKKVDAEEEEFIDEIDNDAQEFIRIFFGLSEEDLK